MESAPEGEDAEFWRTGRFVDHARLERFLVATKRREDRSTRGQARCEGCGVVRKNAAVLIICRRSGGRNKRKANTPAALYDF